MTRRGKLHDSGQADVMDVRERSDEEKAAFERFISKIEKAFPHLKSSVRGSDRKRTATASNRARRILRGVDF
jgi:hypothetical protein